MRKIVGQLADALEYVHDFELIHGDVKPSNVMLSNTGQVKLIDFGLVRSDRPRSVEGASRGSSPSSPTGFVAGTPRYMAPEQFALESWDNRVDWYGLACIAYEALTGGPVVDANELFAIIREQERFVLPPASEIGSRSEPPDARLPRQRTQETTRGACRRSESALSVGGNTPFSEGVQNGAIGYAVPHSVYPAGYHCDPSQPLPFAGIAAQKNHIGLYLFCVYTDPKLEVKRPQFSWTLIRGESNVQGGGGNGSIEERAGEGVGGDGGSPEGDRSARRRRGR